MEEDEGYFTRPHPLTMEERMDIKLALDGELFLTQGAACRQDCDEVND